MRFQTFTTEITGSTVIIRITAENIEVANVEQFIHEVTTVGLPQGCRVIVDLARVKHTVSSGLGALITLRSRAQERGGSIALIGVNAQLREVLKITRLDGIFGVFANVEQALAA